jgi:hypothetical protein
VVALLRPYIHCMKNRDLKLNRYPTPEELYALERAARVARSVEIARLARKAFATVKKFLSTDSTKGLRHA